MSETKISIHRLKRKECRTISDAFAKQGWNKPEDQYIRYWEESQEGKRLVLVAESGSEFVGYLTVVWVSNYPPFRNRATPEIVDFNVLEKFQRMGIGTALMEKAEEHVSRKSKELGIAVGISSDYGKAQRLYSKRGYVFDGKGLYANGKWLETGETVKLTDGVNLFAIKVLRN